MKRVLSVISVIMTLCILMSCTAVGVSAAPAQEPQPPGYVRYPVAMIMAGMPKSIKAQFDFDRNYIDVAPDYPSYNGTGFIFPLATTEYGNMYDVSYTVNDTVITYTYSLKDGYGLDDYLDALDAVNEANGAAPVSRGDGSRHVFRIFDIVMKINNAAFLDYFAQVAEQKMLEVVTVDGKSLDVTTNMQNSEVYCHYDTVYLPDPNAPAIPDETQKEYKYKDKLLSQYHISEYSLLEYDEIYEHTDESGEVDWALVKAKAEGQSSPGGTNPAYYEFGNRVLDIEDRYEPFAFGMGVYSVKHGCFFDVSAPELYELDDLERVWTELGAGRLMGDMDDNNDLDIVDSLLIQRCQARIIDYPDNDRNIPSDMVDNPIGYYSDFDQDGDRSVLDATSIQRYLANMNYRPAGWTPYPHKQKQEPTEPAPTEPAPTESAPTEPAPQPTEPDIDPSIPRITGFKSTGFGVEISLSRVEGAEKYRVYYMNKNGEWKSMGETTSSTFVDSDVKVGTTYRYTVRCIKADLSAFTSDFYRPGWTYAYDPHLDTPQIIRIEAVDNGSKITWAPVEGADLYRVYYKYNGWTKIVDTRDTSCIHTAITPSQTLIYTVRCLSQDGKDFASDYDHDGTTFHLELTPDITNMEAHMDGISFTVHGNYAPGNIAVYRKESNGWKRIGEVPSKDTIFTDTDVQAGKTYTYTCRCLSEDGSYFISKFDKTGWTIKYTAENCIPELEFAIFDENMNIPLVQIKADNKFNIDMFAVDIFDVNDYMGTYIIGNDPCYLNADFWQIGRAYRFYIVGIDENDNVITSVKEGGEYIYILGSPKDLRVNKIGDRQYRFSWSRGSNDSSHYYLNLYSEDGELLIESDIIDNPRYDIDLSDYPNDIRWNCLVWSGYERNPSASYPISLEFCEAEFR